MHSSQGSLSALFNDNVNDDAGEAGRETLTH